MASKTTSKKSTRSKKKAKPQRPRALVTGAGGALAQLLCRRLHRTHRVMGTDKRPFPDRPKDVEHHRIDLRRKSALRLLKKKKPEVIVHLGVMHNPRKEMGHEAYHNNIDVMRQLIQLAESVGSRKFIFLSTANLYGPSATTSGFLTEEAPLLGAAKSPEVRDLISLDMMAQTLFWKRPEIETVILRPVHIVGPHLRNAPSKYLRRTPTPTILGFDPMIQVIHELDVVRAIIQAIEPGARGVFNLMGRGQAPLSRLISARGSRALPVPEPVFKAILERAFRMRLSTFPSTELMHLKYSCLVDGTHAKEELGFEPSYTLKETVHDLG